MIGILSLGSISLSLDLQLMRKGRKKEKRKVASLFSLFILEELLEKLYSSYRLLAVVLLLICQIIRD